MLDPAYSSTQIQLLLKGSSNFEALRHNLEGPHASFHSNVGGDMYRPSTSVNDPVFILHHRNLDRLWDQWQRNTTAGYDYYGVDSDGFAVKPSDILNMQGLGIGYNVSNVMRTNNGMYGGLMCFTYSNPLVPSTTITKRSVPKGDDKQTSDKKSKKTPKEDDRTDEIHVRVPHFPNEEFFQLWNFTEGHVARIKETHEAVIEFTEYLNSLDIELPSSLGKQKQGSRAGWRPKSPKEQKKDDDDFDSLIKNYKGKKPKE